MDPKNTPVFPTSVAAPVVEMVYRLAVPLKFASFGL
jgi:hypothetical protein